jgi:ABC-type hemin transport system ATPase subunit
VIRAALILALLTTPVAAAKQVVSLGGAVTEIVVAQDWTPTAQGRARCVFLDEPIASLDIEYQL